MRDDSDEPAPGRATILGELADVLDVATELVTSLARDGVFHRLIEAFHSMPFEDRETVVGAIEREVSARRLSRATQDLTGRSMHPNPHARLYMRAHETVVPRGELDRDELMLSMLRGMRVTPALLVPELRQAWRDGTREALRHLEPATRGIVADLARELLMLAEEPAPAEAAPLAVVAG
jgi:hypothetical protein